MLSKIEYRKLEIYTALTKAKSREPSYSQTLNQNKIDRQRSKSRESGSQTAMGPYIKDVRRDGGGVRSNADTCVQGDGCKGPFGRPQDGTFFNCFTMLCRHSLRVMPI